MLDSTDEFLLLTPTGAMKTLCVRRLEGNNAWDLQFLNLCVGNPWNATGRSTQQGPTIQTKDELANGKRAKRLYLVGIGQHTEECRARIEQEMVGKGDAVEIWASEEIVQEPDASLNKRKTGEPDINPDGASSLTADTPKRRESEQGSSAENESVLAGCIAAVNKLFCDMPSVDLSRDRTARSGKFPENELRAGRELELRNMLNFDAFELVNELLPGKYAYDMVWVDEWRGDRVRSRLCVRQLKAEGLRNDLFAGTLDAFFIKYLLVKAASCKEFAFMHARTVEEIYVKVPTDIRSSKFWRLKAALNGTRKASKHWQEYSSNKLVTNMLFQQNDINTASTSDFKTTWIWSSTATIFWWLDGMSG